MNDDDKEKLRSYLEVLKSAMWDIQDVFDTGYMSDAKSVIYALSDQMKQLGLADAAMEEELVALAADCWHNMYRDGADDAYGKAGRAAVAIGRLERRIKALMNEAA